MILYWLTLIVAAVVVLVLALYLIAIAWALARARKSVAGIADGLEAIAGHTSVLEEKVGTIDGALKTVAEHFTAADEHLDGAAQAFQR
jgi:uncharacterized protein YoxC